MLIWEGEPPLTVQPAVKFCPAVMLDGGDWVQLMVTLPTVTASVLEAVPPEPLRACTVYDPDPSVAGPLTCEALLVNTPLGTTHVVLVAHPGPRKNTSTVLVLNPLPLIVKLNCWPPIGGLGEVVTLLSDGVTADGFT